jgi:superfamily II DNA or RNA helicase
MNNLALQVDEYVLTMHELQPHQEEAVKNLGNGKILHGGVGSGKTRTVLSYYKEKESPRDIVVITTAKKRDSMDWETEAARFGISTAQEYTSDGALIVESWNNISKFEGLQDRFFIFDEQRLVGNGAWVKSFLKISRNNRWILLSATPGDSWLDYAPVFIANGFYKNITDFKMQHVVYEAFSKYPKIKGYLNEQRLEVLRNDVLVEMPYERHTTRVINYIDVEYNHNLFNTVFVRRWNPYDDAPVRDIAEVFRLMRRVVNEHPSRLEMVRKLMTCHDKLIIFYTFNFELEILRTLADDITVAEWNGHRKQPIPDTDKWVYLVQYTSGAEGWNCVDTNAMIMYSMTYSYKNFEQCQGRIDRLNTPFDVLYYYILASNSVIDRGIKESLASKKSFNERKFYDKLIDSIELEQC